MVVGEWDISLDLDGLRSVSLEHPGGKVGCTGRDAEKRPCLGIETV